MNSLRLLPLLAWVLLFMSCNSSPIAVNHDDVIHVPDPQIKVNLDSLIYHTVTITIHGVTISGNSISRSRRGIREGETDIVSPWRKLLEVSDSFRTVTPYDSLRVNVSYFDRQVPGMPTIALSLQTDSANNFRLASYGSHDGHALFGGASSIQNAYSHWDSIPYKVAADGLLTANVTAKDIHAIYSGYTESNMSGWPTSYSGVDIKADSITVSPDAYVKIQFKP